MAARRLTLEQAAKELLERKPTWDTPCLDADQMCARAVLEAARLCKLFREPGYHPQVRETATIILREVRRAARGER